VGVSRHLQGDAGDGRPTDFIVVDGKEGGTGAAPLEFADHIGLPMREGSSSCATLGRPGLRGDIRIGVSGKIATPSTWPRWRSARLVQRRPRLHVRARLHPVAVLHTDRCPTGVATQTRRAPARWWSRTRRARAQLPPLDAARAGGTDRRAGSIIARLPPCSFLARISPSETRTFAGLYRNCSRAG